MVLLIPLVSISDNVTGLLVAIFGGAAASLAAGYFARPRTKAEAKKENATADVSMSGDAREWANFWAQKAQEAEAKNQSCEERADAAEERTRTVERDRMDLVLYVRVLEEEMERRTVLLPPVSARLRDVIEHPEDH